MEVESAQLSQTQRFYHLYLCLTKLKETQTHTIDSNYAMRREDIEWK